MEVIKRKILIESLLTRKSGLSYGTMTASTISVDIFLKQTIDDMGMFKDVEFSDEEILYPLNNSGSPNYNNPLVGKLIDSGITFNFMSETLDVPTPLVSSDFYKDGELISAYTSSRITELKRYNVDSPYVEDFPFNRTQYVDYQGSTINGVSQVFDLTTPSYTGYTFDAEDNSSLGTPSQTTGLMYRDFGIKIPALDDELNMMIYQPMAKVSYMAQGWNQTNTSLAATIKDEKYLGITSPPEVQSEVFIERGSNNVLEPHLRLSEIESLEHLEKYGNGSYYKIEKQSL